MVVATYCFLERPAEVWAEACVHGFIQAVRDFPHCKSREQVEREAQSLPDVLRSEVCCIPGNDDYPYRQLVVSACVSTYMGFVRDTSERQQASWALTLKDVPEHAALAELRPGFQADALGAIQDAYAHYLSLAAIRTKQTLSS